MSTDRAEVGVLGSGQLSRMLWEASTLRLGKKTLVFSPHAGSSAEKAGAEIFFGEVTDDEKVESFCRIAQNVVIESEFIPVSVLSHLKTSPQAEKWTPSIQSLILLQTKLGQKRLLEKLGIPTPDFTVLSADRAGLLSPPFVLKTSTGGYDGKGVLFVDSSDDLTRIPEFLTRNNGTEIYCEPKVKFARELGLIGARDSSGGCFFYPLVETRQRNGVCEAVLSLEPEVRAIVQPQAEVLVRRLMKELDWRGVLAVEFFLDHGNQLWVNELAPRVHNSGHFTLNASSRSQFEVQILSACGEELNPQYFESRPSFAMLNLLGPENYRGPVPPIRILKKGLSQPYDYEKGTSTPGRKLGHWNWVSDTQVSRADLEKVLDELKQEWDSWTRGHLK